MWASWARAPRGSLQELDTTTYGAEAFLLPANGLNYCHDRVGDASLHIERRPLSSSSCKQTGPLQSTLSLYQPE